MSSLFRWIYWWWLLIEILPLCIFIDSHPKFRCDMAFIEPMHHNKPNITCLPSIERGFRLDSPQIYFGFRHSVAKRLKNVKSGWPIGWRNASDDRSWDYLRYSESLFGRSDRWITTRSLWYIEYLNFRDANHYSFCLIITHFDASNVHFCLM